MKTSLVRRSPVRRRRRPAADRRPAACRDGAEQIPLRISTPAVPDDWHAMMWTVFRESLDKSAPGEFDVQINLNATLFKQGTEHAAMARGTSTCARSRPRHRQARSRVLDLHRRLRDPRPDHRTRCSTARWAKMCSWSGEDGRQGAVVDLSRHAAAQPARGAQRQDARRSQGREAAHAGVEGVAVPRRGAGRDGDAAGVRRGLPGPQDRHHRRPGQPAALGARRQVLRSHQAAGPDRPPRRRHLPVDRQQDLERARRPPRSRRSRRPPSPRRSTTTRTSSRRKASWSTSSSSRACRSRPPTSTRFASTCRASTSLRSTPRSGRRESSSASTRPSKSRCASG